MGEGQRENETQNPKQAPGSRLQAPGSRLQAPGSELQFQGFGFLGPLRSWEPGLQICLRIGFLWLPLHKQCVSLLYRGLVLGFLSFFNVCLFLREREESEESWGGVERKRETQNLK